ncbi:MAG: two-component system alkaline phosphatase synthesis response regulator PhoP [Psychromonas sp.]|jgi:two-component system alkaline phosphatase synthesis response regulator PhoP
MTEKATLITVVEDERSIAEMLQLNLELEGHVVQLYKDGNLASENTKSISQSDLVLLDVMLPGKSGFELCQMIRKHSQVPIIMLSAKGTTGDRIQGLKLGANDYLPKPFDLEELLLRINNLLPAMEVILPETFAIGKFTVNPMTYELTNEMGKTIETFSKKEIELLKLFSSEEGKVVSRVEILDKVWGEDQFPTSRTIDNYILAFRKIFEQDPKQAKHFHSIRGVGYKFNR